MKSKSDKHIRVVQHPTRKGWVIVWTWKGKTGPRRGDWRKVWKS